MRCGRCRAAHAPAAAEATRSRGREAGSLRADQVSLSPSELLRPRTAATQACSLDDLARRAGLLPVGPLQKRAAEAFDLREFDAALNAGRPARCLAQVQALVAALESPGDALSCVQHEQLGGHSGANSAARESSTEPEWLAAPRPELGGAHGVGRVSAPARRGSRSEGRGRSRGASAAARTYLADVLRGRHQARSKRVCPAP